MNKRAISEHGILTVIFAIIVVIGIAVIYPLVGRLLWGGGGEYHTAATSLGSLSQAVAKVLASQKPFDAVRNFNLFIQDNSFIIVAFNAEDDKVQSGCYDESAARPVACPADRSCLCLYEDTAGQDFDDDITTNPPKLCEPFPGNVVFMAPENANEDFVDGKNDETKKWNFGVARGAPSISAVGVPGPMGPFLVKTGELYGYENLLLYGECDSMSWNSQPVYVEKFESNGGFYVYVARESAKTAKRYDVLKLAVGVSFVTISRLIEDGKYGEAVSEAFIMYGRYPPNEPLAAKVSILLGEAWEKLAEVSPERGSGEISRIEDNSYRGRVSLVIRDEGFRNGALQMALYHYQLIIETFGKRTVAEVPELADAALRAYFLADLLGGPKEKYWVLLQELKNANPELDERMTIALLRSEQKRIRDGILGQRPGYDWDSYVRSQQQALQSFLAKYSSSEYRREALYFLAEAYTLPSAVQSKGEALAIYMQILREYKEDFRLPGMQDPKEFIWKDCFNGAYPGLEAECEASVGVRPSVINQEEFAQLEKRKAGFVRFKDFADRAASEGYPGVAIDAYQKFLKAYTSDVGTVKYAEPDDYVILVRVYLALVRHSLALRQPQAAGAWLGYASQYLSNVVEPSALAELNQQYASHSSALQFCIANVNQGFACQIP